MDHISKSCGQTSLLTKGRAMAKRKKEKTEPVCGTCGKPFDRRKAAEAARSGRAFIHECGRVLVRERSGGNAEVPTHHHVYIPGSDYWGKRSNPSAGDA